MELYGNFAIGRKHLQSAIKEMTIKGAGCEWT
jgi:hypothetical protein